MKKTNKSKALYKQAIKIIPGGVNSPVRAFKAVGGNPLFIKKGQGQYIYDVDGNKYLDYVLSWGPLILGHAQNRVIKSTKQVLTQGLSFGAPIKAEIDLANIITKAIPSIEQIRLVSSGTEAAMSAIRLARSYTKKNKIIKFEGCYHGHSESLLVRAGSGSATFGVPTSSGVLPDFIKNTIVLPFNDIPKLKKAIQQNHQQIAAVILEPVCGNMGVVTAEKEFLFCLHKMTRKFGILLIFDEVMTGFRFCFGGVQKILKINPDITCLGKIIGGGLPIGAYGANRKIMQHVSPLGAMYQAGTLSGNPVAVASGLKTLQILQKMNYNKINELCQYLCLNLEQICQEHTINVCVQYAGSMFTLFFTKSKVTNFKQAVSSDTKRYAKFFRAMLNQGIYFAPSQFEANFISFKHTKKDIDTTLSAFKRIIRYL
ncbi:MAG: glutamate-1-semialdehyde 2,1-aminomutase [Candidatus Omnitrophota bacterium]